jgi:tricarballylate dehydrogenase
VAVINYGILVNHRGERFIDEGADRYELIYDEVSWSIMRQKRGIAHLIFDGRLFDIPNVRIRIKTDQAPIRASSVEQLAALINVDSHRLTETLHAYNAAVQPGPYDHSLLDGRATHGLTPAKSNWAREINDSDLYAYPIMCANTFTCGGLKVTKNAEVVNRDGAPIPGLYAAGETVGLYYNLYVGATSVLRGIVLGRQAGKHVAARLKERVAT